MYCRTSYFCYLYIFIQSMTLPERLYFPLLRLSSKFLKNPKMQRKHHHSCTYTHKQFTIFGLQFFSTQNKTDLYRNVTVVLIRLSHLSLFLSLSLFLFGPDWGNRQNTHLSLLYFYLIISFHSSFSFHVSLNCHQRPLDFFLISDSTLSGDTIRRLSHTFLL